MFSGCVVFFLRPGGNSGVHGFCPDGGQCGGGRTYGNYRGGKGGNRPGRGGRR